LLGTGTSATNATLYYGKLNFNFIRDIAPVAAIIRAPLVMLVQPSLPAKTVPEFIDHAKANPGKINMASAGIGSINHVAFELFKTMAGLNMVHVPSLLSPITAPTRPSRISSICSPQLDATTS
jgi:tripartite-type tricarboxylate transporter receptor subunit TctC